MGTLPWMTPRPLDKPLYLPSQLPFCHLQKLQLASDVSIWSDLSRGHEHLGTPRCGHLATWAVGVSGRDLPKTDSQKDGGWLAPGPQASSPFPADLSVSLLSLGPFLGAIDPLVPTPGRQKSGAWQAW